MRPPTDNPQHTQETPRQAHNGLKALSCPLCRSNGTILIDLPQFVIRALRQDASCSHCGTHFESLSITQAEGGSCSLTWTRRGG